MSWCLCFPQLLVQLEYPLFVVASLPDPSLCLYEGQKPTAAPMLGLPFSFPPGWGLNLGLFQPLTRVSVVRLLLSGRVAPAG